MQQASGSQGSSGLPNSVCNCPDNNNGGMNTENRNTYKTPRGGGVTDKIKVGKVEVSFGHGGRHLDGTGLSVQEVNKIIAQDVVDKNLNIGQFYKGQVNINGITIEYTSFGLKDGMVNIGTYYPIW